MKIWDLAIITFSLSILGIIVSALIIGQKHFDFNVWIALLIYTAPALILSYSNGIALISVEKNIKNIYHRIGLGLIPMLVLVGFLLWNESFMHYIAIFGLIPVTVTYLYWVYTLKKKT